MEVSDDEAVIGGWVGDVLERGQLPLIQKSGGTKDIVDARVKPEETHFFVALIFCIYCLHLPACCSRIGTSSECPVVNEAKPVKLLGDIFQRGFPTVLLPNLHDLVPFLQAIVCPPQGVEVAHPQLRQLLVEDLLQVFRYPNNLPMSQVRVLVDQVDACEEEFTPVWQLNPCGQVAGPVAVDARRLRKERVIAFLGLELLQGESSLAEDCATFPTDAELEFRLPDKLEQAGLLPTRVHL